MLFTLRTVLFLFLFLFDIGVGSELAGLKIEESVTFA
jgi:hypothetical protein